MVRLCIATHRPRAGIPLGTRPRNEPSAGRTMSETRASGIGFLKATKARHAEEAIGHSEGLVTVLKLTQADLKPAEEALRIAKDLFISQDYVKALRAARRAESLAITLDERYSGYQKAEKALRSRIAEMLHLGLNTEHLEAMIGRAEEKILGGIWENGAFVPNYLEARVILGRTEQEGPPLQDKAERASNGIFLAELSMEALVETKGPAGAGRPGDSRKISTTRRRSSPSGTRRAPPSSRRKSSGRRPASGACTERRRSCSPTWNRGSATCGPRASSRSASSPRG